MPARATKPKAKVDRELLAFAKGAAAAERFRPGVLGHLLLFTIVLFFGVMVTWASWATLEEVTRGDGRVIPSRRVQVVQNLEGGIVEEILVRDGDIVEDGQILMR
ncbi:MAG: HlyD family type I secretion periplasmic adaptor subunit, partial [Pseudomonadota bacterium]